MRLKRIKLAGFKSFVEPTSVSLPHDLIGVVGPNGCGKSNIIDAVRWVMGEISAKLLRGDSMEDVIFNGSSARKPVGKAFVELIFDNTSERVKGPYAKFSEINVRREVSRDGQSKYFLNKSRVRRRDVMDLFLGTGLGPRSYSIIEQGMVNRIVESKPEELRLFVEEAAGISKYKERRRETENRIKHTRENLDRVEDIRQELDKQLQRLKRQSKTAERYKALKQKERELKAQLAAIRWLEIGEQLEQHDKELARLETALQAAIASQREKETRIEEIRQQQGEASEQFNTVQAGFYDVSASVARLEQTIKHEREKLEDRQRQKEGLESTIASIQAHIQSDTSLIQNYTETLEAHEQSRSETQQQLEQVTQALQSVATRLEQSMQQLQELERAAADRQREQEVRQVRVREINSRLERRGKSEMRLGAEFQQLSERVEGSRLEALKQQLEKARALYDASRAEHDAARAGISQSREQLADINEQLSGLREKRQSLAGRLESLLEVQAAENDSQSEAWARQHKLADDDRLYRQLKVEPGWEAAVDAVLGRAMQAWCTDRLADLLHETGDAGARLALFQTGDHRQSGGDTLLAKILAAPVDMGPVLDGIYVASSMDSALDRAAHLQPGESVVTADGTHIGPNWSVLSGGAAAADSILARQTQIEKLQRSLQALDEQIQQLSQQQGSALQTLKDTEQKEAEARSRLQKHNGELSSLQQSFGREETLHDQNQSRLQQLTSDLNELREQIARDHQLLQEQQSQAETLVDTGAEEQQMKQATQLLQKLRAEDNELRQKETALRDALHRIELDQRETRVAHESATTNIQRLQTQLVDLDNRRQQFLSNVSDETDPTGELQKSLEALLDQRETTQEKLNQARNRVAELDNRLREAEQARHDAEAAVLDAREKLESSKMQHQELLVRRETMVENMAEHGVIPEEICQTLADDVSVDSMSREVADVSSRIIKLGAVNLAAIDEYEEQAERKTHIDSQYDDLVRALELLEASIRKINNETRTRFRETFDAINASFQQFFPRLFGGGHAVLELTGDDMLDAGVTVMARPPGKRNSTIHLLSGGEKALTAVSLVFAIFELNPAPFCLLDEVDAPLDDANVHRYTAVLRDLAEHSQLIFITHNKITMEAADILIGVTMGEPGVSRLVAVDIDQAVEIAAQVG